MGKAVRAIIVENNKILLMHRSRDGSEYFTLVGGLIKSNETAEEALRREVKEETGLDIASSRLVFAEEHPAPYNQQYIFLCKAKEHGDLAIQDTAEEALMNKLDINIHKPAWVDVEIFPKVAFSTSGLQSAIVDALKNGFPKVPQRL